MHLNAEQSMYSFGKIVLHKNFDKQGRALDDPLNFIENLKEELNKYKDKKIPFDLSLLEIHIVKE